MICGRPGILDIGISAAAAFSVAALGGALTVLGPWYYELRQPPWKPPDWLFGPAWSVIFFCIACAAVVAWRRAPDRRHRRALLGALGVNAALNIAWSALFFRLQRPDWALLEITALWLSIALMAWQTYPYARPAAVLLLPYLSWVSFAACLNWSVVRLNGPFA